MNTLIINNTNTTFSPSSQQAIDNAAVNCGVDKIYTDKNATDGGNDSLFNFFDEDDNYLFSIDTNGDVIFDCR